MRLVNSDLRELGLKLCTCTTARGNQSQSWEWRAMMILSAGDMLACTLWWCSATCSQLPSLLSVAIFASLLAIAARSCAAWHLFFSLWSDSSKRGPRPFAIGHCFHIECVVSGHAVLQDLTSQGTNVLVWLSTSSMSREVPAESFYCLLIADQRSLVSFRVIVPATEKGHLGTFSWNVH